MDSFEANKIIGAVLGTIFVLFGGSLLAEGIFHSEAPEQPGYAIVAPDEPEAGAAGGGEAPAEEPIAVLLASADAEAGAGVFKRCASCHNGGKGEANKVGPVLWDVVNRPIASVPGFGYSAAMQAFSEGGAVAWDYEHLNGFLVNPKGHVPGTSMGFAGLKKPDERANLIAYLRSLSDSPAPLPEAPAAAPADAPAAPAEGAAAPEAAPAAGAEAPAEGAPAAAAPEVTEPSATTNAGNPAQQPQAPATTDVDTIMPPIGDPTTMVPSAGQPGTGAAPGGAGTNEPTANSSTAPAAQGTVQPGTQGVSATQQQQEQEQRLQQQQQPAAPAEAAPAQPAPVQPPSAAPAPTEAVPAPAAPVPVEAAPAPAAPAQPPSGTQQFTVPVQPAPTAPQPQ